MGRLLFLCLFTTALGWTACSQTESEDVAEDGQSLLWRIEGNGLETPSYLYGTIHLISTNDFIFTPRMKSIIAESKQVVFEMDLNMEDMLKAQLMAMYKGDTTLATFYTPEQFDTIKTFFLDTLQISQMEWEVYKKTKPFFLTEAFFSSYVDGPITSYEFVFKAFADSLEIPVRGLESIQEQLSFVNDIPIERQAEMILQSIKEFHKDKLLMERLVAFYKAGQLDSIGNAMKEYPEFEEIEEKLITHRNQNWVSQIDSMVREKRSFIAVGAGHLPGEDGVIKLLEAEGYTLIPIKTR